ncbi:hypothetical protein F0562_035099 [Nyssa sinensis]|uniref:Uncharacterized protein n=1 Tax=Nyssa sinensis TaxID=561372 RepID=A0A5J5ADS8_9ASTE|nr:hypothetical protein F0562_035099 [Nyssa sinensis]
MMTNSNPKFSASNSRRISKRLLFDRRYGWILDEWKDPSEEALAGGRGMFCVVPLAKALFNMASQSINFAASSAVKVLERPDLLSPKILQASLNDQLHKCVSAINKPEFRFFALKGNSPSNPTGSSVHPNTESSESQNG